MAPPNSIDAPYNFVPLADWVHCPEWAGQVSHDLPFKDGICGHLDLKITTHTPLLVGGRQQKATNNAPGQVHPFQLPDGRYAIPGTSLKGMIRSVVEIASFSRMGMVDDIRYGLRDISGRYVKDAYTNRVRNQVKAGFMRLGKDGLPVVTPCKMVMLPHRDLEAWLDIKAPIFPMDRAVNKKYLAWTDLCLLKSKNPSQLSFTPVDETAADLGKGITHGTPVFTGQISRSTDDKGKKNDFVFFDEQKKHEFGLTLREWADFLYVHGDQATKDAAGMSWPGYWKKHYWQDEAVPVFFIRDGGMTRIGLAYMPRLAGDFSTHEMIAHTNSEHLNGQGRGTWDFAETMFGAVGATPTDCLKGRLTFGLATTERCVQSAATEPTILNGPKASYFPNYVRQNADSRTWRLTSRGYATCLKTSEHPKPEIRGWKRYPARPTELVQPLTEEQRKSEKKNTQVMLFPLKAGIEFNARIDFHNLKAEELGALLWALTWGGSEYRHGLGMAKPFGFGQIGISIAGSSLRCNEPESVPEALEEYRDRFIYYMENISQHPGYTWRDSAQIEGLLGMADIESARPQRLKEVFKGDLKHMVLETRGKNEFLHAKQEALVLGEYPRVKHPETFAERQEKQALEIAKQSEIQAERERLERERVEREKVQAAFDALPDERRLMHRIRSQIDSFHQLSQNQRPKQRENLIPQLNRLADLVVSKPDVSLREEAANLLVEAWDTIGWWDPGKKGDKRQKQELKRRARVDEVRQVTSG